MQKEEGWGGGQTPTLWVKLVAPAEDAAQRVNEAPLASSLYSI